MTIAEKIKRIRTFRKMTQKELAIRIGLGENGGHRLVQYENGYRLPKKDLVDKMAKALDVNPYALYDTNGHNATEIMEMLFWLDDSSPSTIKLHSLQKFPGEKCNESNLTCIKGIERLLFYLILGGCHEKKNISVIMRSSPCNQ